MNFLVLLLLSTSSYADEFWSDKCLKKHLSKCTSKKLELKDKYTKEEREILACRIKALAKCRKEKINEVRR